MWSVMNAQKCLARAYFNRTLYLVFRPLHTPTMLGFLATYACANLYVIWLVVLYWPGFPSPIAASTAADTEDREAAALKGRYASSSTPSASLKASGKGRASTATVVLTAGEGVDTTSSLDFGEAKAAGAARAHADLVAKDVARFDLSDSDDEGGV